MKRRRVKLLTPLPRSCIESLCVASEKLYSESNYKHKANNTENDRKYVCYGSGHVRSDRLKTALKCALNTIRRSGRFSKHRRNVRLYHVFIPFPIQTESIILYKSRNTDFIPKPRNQAKRQEQKTKLMKR